MLPLPAGASVTIVLEHKGMKTVQTEVPEQLYAQLRSLVTLGWFQDEGDVIQDALRRFLETHRPDIMDEFVRQDVE